MKHEVEFLGRDRFQHAPADHQWIAECTCHNPDGDGDGRADFYGATAAEAVNNWLDHHDEKWLEQLMNDGWRESL